MSPEFEFVTSGVVPGSRGVYRGHEEVRRFTERFWDAFEDTRGEIHDSSRRKIRL